MQRSLSISRGNFGPSGDSLRNFGQPDYRRVISFPHQIFQVKHPAPARLEVLMSMPAIDRLNNSCPNPVAFEVTGKVLSLESVLTDLSMYQFQVEVTCTGAEVARVFEQYPLLPGVVLMHQGQYLGMLSRRQLLEYLLKPHGAELFLTKSLAVLYSYARGSVLILPPSTPILQAAQQALRRSPEQQSEPIVVQRTPGTYCLLDVHELNIAYWQIRGIETQVRYERSQVQMLQTEKMASLGRLVDGIAHEILDPVGFIWGNLSHVTLYVDQVMELLHAYESLFPELPPSILKTQADIELDYLAQDLPRAIESIRSGSERLKKLVTSLQNFCHVDEVYPKPTDLHDCLDGILLLLKSRLSSDIQIVRNYGQLPPVSCYIGQLSQVFMNILTNAVDVLINQAAYQDWAAQCMGDRPEFFPLCLIKPQIFITTEMRSHPDPATSPRHSELSAERMTCRWVSIRIANNGHAMSPETLQQVLDSFTVERRSAKETSLALSYQIVTAKHGGKFYLRSPCFPINYVEPDLPNCPNPATEGCLTGGGTEFEIVLPV
jgi:signal transduction histidine kinase